MDFKNIKNIIFDLGGVIINIDMALTFQAFAELTGTDTTYMTETFRQHQVFQRFETGLLSEEEFVEDLRKVTGLSCSIEDLHLAWNKLLLDIPSERIKLLQYLNKKYRTFLLSNTNSIHIAAVEKTLEASSGVATLHDLFEKVYYSYQVNKIKPAADIYEMVLHENNLLAEETVFIDDNLDNVLAAEKLGIKIIHIQPPYTILEHLKNA